MKKCMGCMRDYEEVQNACPYCGYTAMQQEADRKTMPEALPAETILAGRFILGRILSLTDYSALYIAWDALLHRRLVIREYLPIFWISRDVRTGNLDVDTQQHRALFEQGQVFFEREAQILNRVQDLPVVACVYRHFRERGTSYMVMEYLEGITLQDYLDSAGDKEVREKADGLFEKLCKALEELQKRKLIHGNLNPDNIYLDEEGKILLIDFGLAKFETRRLSGGLIQTLDPRYMSPELGRPGAALSSSADMYALGAIYYRLLSGKEPPSGRRSKVSWKGQSLGRQKALGLLLQEDPKDRIPTVEAFYRALDPKAKEQG